MFTSIFTLYFALTAAVGPFLCCCAVRVEAASVTAERQADHEHPHCHHSHGDSPCHGSQNAPSPSDSSDYDPHNCPCDHDQEPVANDAHVVMTSQSAADHSANFNVPTALLILPANGSQAGHNEQLDASCASLRSGRDILRAYSILRC
jgi:hypothetical protein